VTDEIEEDIVSGDPHAGVLGLNPVVRPAAAKVWGCQGCKLFQYAPCFTKGDREVYQAKLDPDRRDRKNCQYMIEGEGPDDADIMAVMEYPYAQDDKAGSCAVGGTGWVIRKNADIVGLKPNKWRFTYAVRCRVPQDVTLNNKAASYCSRFLAAEIHKVKPRVILAFGSMTTQLLLGKPDASINHFATIPQDTVVAGHRCLVYPMFSPGMILANDWMAKRYLEHFDKLAQFLKRNGVAATDGSNYQIIRDPDEAIALCQKMVASIEEGITIDVDTETSGLNPYKIGSRLSVVSLARSKKRGYAILFNHDECPWTPLDRKRVVAEGLKPLLTHPQGKFRLHNAKFDYKWFAQHLGFWPRDIVEDTMLTHYAADENEEHGLKSLALKFTDMGDYDAELDGVLAEQTYEDAPRYDLVESNLLGKYAGMDSVATRKLAVELRKLVDSQDGEVDALAYRAMPAFSAALTRMEHNGITIDRHFAETQALPVLKAEAAKSWESIVSQPTVCQFRRDKEAAARAKMKKPKPEDVKKYFEFSLGSQKQLAELLFSEKYYNHEVLSVTSKGVPGTDKEVMETLANDYESPIARAICEYRLDEKLVGTYLEPIIAFCAEQGDSTLHANFLLHSTKTGRLSSRGPNLQNIPSKAAGLIKRMYVSRYGKDGCFVQADYSQIELRIIAAVSGDEKMIDAYATGKDLHMLTACLIFDMTEEDYHKLPKDEQKRRRTVAKRVNFGIAYGIGGEGIKFTLGKDGVVVDVDTARSYLDSFYEKYPKVTRWLDRIHKSSAEHEFSRSLFGRRRRLEQFRSRVKDVIARAERQAANHVIQSTASDFTMTALTLMDQEICVRRGDNPALILPTVTPRKFEDDGGDWSKVHQVVTVHDMDGIDCHVSMAPRVVDMMYRTMQGVIDLAPLVWGDQVTKRLQPMRKVSPDAEVEVGPNWRDAYKVKTGADVPLAMYIANAKRVAFDQDVKFKWTEDLEKDLKAKFAKEAA
jgi:uracil-DNA glycosylase family 4